MRIWSSVTMRASTVLLIAPLVLACGAEQAPPPIAPTAPVAAMPPPSVASDSTTAPPSSSPNAPVSDESFTAKARRLFCASGGLASKCFVVPDEAACIAVFDEAWPSCSRDYPAHSGTEEAARKARDTGRCMGTAFAARFQATAAEECRRLRDG